MLVKDLAGTFKAVALRDMAHDLRVALHEAADQRYIEVPERAEILFQKGEFPRPPAVSTLGSGIGIRARGSAYPWAGCGEATVVHRPLLPQTGNQRGSLAKFFAQHVKPP